MISGLVSLTAPPIFLRIFEALRSGVGFEVQLLGGIAVALADAMATQVIAVDVEAPGR